MTLRGDLHLIERLDHVSRLRDGRWISGYWELSDFERSAVKRVFLHRTKAEPAHWGGTVVDVLPASDFSELATKHETNPAGRWVLVVMPDKAAKHAPWRGVDHQMAYKSLV
jgi:hypothetical protein